MHRVSLLPFPFLSTRNHGNFDLIIRYSRDAAALIDGPETERGRINDARSRDRDAQR